MLDNRGSTGKSLSAPAFVLRGSVAIAAGLLAVSSASAQQVHSGSSIERVSSSIREAIRYEQGTVQGVLEGHWGNPVLAAIHMPAYSARAELDRASRDLRDAVDAGEIDQQTADRINSHIDNAETLDSKAVNAAGRRDANTVVEWLKKAIAEKEIALRIATAVKPKTTPAATPKTQAPCVLGYPAPVAADESTISLTSCKKKLTEVDVTFPSPVKKATSWGVESSKSQNSGACTISGASLDCKLNAPMPTSSTFLVGFAPVLEPSEALRIVLRFSDASTETQQYTVPKPEALRASATAAAVTPSGSAAGTVFIVTLKVSAPIQSVLFDLPAGNGWYAAAVGGLPNMLACGLSGTQYSCLDPTHPTAQAGTYHIVLPFKNPVAAGTKISGHITAGPGPLHGFTFTLG